MGALLNQILKGIFFYLAIVVLVTFFMTTFIEGLKWQLVGLSFYSVQLYFVALLALAAAVWVFGRGKMILARIGIR